ncbi:putative long-chain-alcohol O-fatty-acyltransferase [Helianthus annuus]|nr:putative long-chain-alcohol O-fatty-acyltransferase [Helianthus annuus]
MKGETYNLILDWSIALTSLLYCHTIGMFIAQGKTRFLAIFPVILLFLYLPLNLHSVFHCGLTFFFMSWLGSFKLILYAFGQGPLSSHPTLPLSHFITTACLPIKIIKNQPNPSHQITKVPQRSPKDYAPRVFLLFITLKAYSYKEKFHPLFATSIYAYYIFFALELLLALAASLARTVVGAELEPQFDEPHHATSVQNFWGKRWNLMVSSILRPTVYHPSRAVFSHLLPERWVSVPAVLATFLVSGIMHEMIFYYLGRLNPTWEVTWFFVLQGVWVGTEIVVKKTMGPRFQPPPVVSRALTLAFVMITSFWLFFPPFMRVDPFARFCRECLAVIGFFKHGHLISFVEYSCPYF